MSTVKNMASSGLFGSIVGVSTFFVVLSFMPQAAIAALVAVPTFAVTTYKTFQIANKRK